MKRRLAKILTLFVLTLLLGTVSESAFAQNYERLSDVEAETFGDAAMVNGDYQAMKNVRRYWVQQAQQFKSMKQLEFAITGSNEGILKVTMPARLLFAQNDSTLLTSAEGVLRPLLRLVKGSDAMASMIIAGYTDNNGSPEYLYMISGGRARQVHRWFARQGVGPADLRSFGLANRVPRNENANIAQREKNRRISIFFVPNKKMLRAARKGNL